MRTKDEFGQDSVTVEIDVLKVWASTIARPLGKRQAHRLAETIRSYIPTDRET